MVEPTASGYAPVNGLEMYWESFGSGGPPIVVVHGGYGTIASMAPLVDALAEQRRVVGIELQGHGHTADVDRPFSYEAFGDDIAALAGYLALGQVDLLGYSLGASACLRAAIQHPGVVRKLAVVSVPCRRHGWFPEVLAAFDQMGSAGFAQLRHSPLYEAYAAVAPDPDAFPALMDKVGELQRHPYDWGDELAAITASTMLVFADADSIPTAHMAEFFALLGGGLCDAQWDGSARPNARLAVLAGRTHYDIPRRRSSPGCSAPSSPTPRRLDPGAGAQPVQPPPATASGSPSWASTAWRSSTSRMSAASSPMRSGVWSKSIIRARVAKLDKLRAKASTRSSGGAPRPPAARQATPAR
jgi:pimeloyl-ACP methyl ester carboxylesterase